MWKLNRPFSPLSNHSRSLLRSVVTSTAPTPTTALESPIGATPTTVKSLTRSVLSEGNLRLMVEKFKRASEHGGFRKQSGVYEEVVKRLSVAKRYWWIEEILQDQRQYTDVSKEGFCARLISLYGKAGMFNHASQVFEEMPAMNCQRTIVSFNALLGACVRSKKFHKVEKMFRDLPKKLSVKPDVVSFSILIKAYCEMGSLNSALSLLDEMGKKGLKPNLITFNILLHGFYGNGRFSDGERIWDRMSECGIEPDVWSYNAKLVGLASENKVCVSSNLFEEMKKKELKANVFTFNSLIKCCCNTGDLVDASRWHDELRMNRCKPDNVTYTAIISLSCEKDDFDHAFWLCKQLFYDQVVVEGVLLQRVVDGLVKSSELEKANTLVELGKSNNFCCYKLKVSSEV